MFFDESYINRLPFFPKYNLVKLNNLDIFWFEKKFSQSKYGESKELNNGSHSCTIITILVAEAVASNKLNTSINENLPREIIVAFGLAMIRGNFAYGKYSKAGKITDANLSIPEAMDAAKDYISKLEEWFYVHVNVKENQKQQLTDTNYAQNAIQKLSNVLENGLNTWKLVNFNKDYIFVVIIADFRSILLCFQENQECIIFYDSHLHSPNGAVIVRTERKNLIEMVRWIVQMLFMQIYTTKPQIFEVSFIPIKLEQTGT